MTAATITSEGEGVLAEDNVVLTVTHEETYVTRLSSVVGVHATWNEDIGVGTAVSHPQVAVSGRTITVHADGVTDKKCFLTVKGKL